MIEGARDPARTILGVPTPTAWEVSLSLAHLVVIGLLAVGVSSVLALGMGALWGTSFVAGDPAGVTYTPSRCRELFEYAPGATTCEQAATEHHFAETVVYRGAAGVMGVLGAAAYVWLRRRRPGRPELLPTGFEATIGTTAFGMAALVLRRSRSRAREGERHQ